MGDCSALPLEQMGLGTDNVNNLCVIPDTQVNTWAWIMLRQDRHASLALALDGGFPSLRQSVWQSEASMQASVQALTPQMTENKRKVCGCGRFMSWL